MLVMGFIDAERLVEAEPSHAELAVKLGDDLPELLDGRRHLQGHCELHDAVADALVKHVAAVRGSLVLLKEGPETLPLPVQLRDVYVKQSLYLAEILKRHLVDGAGHGAHDLAGSAVGILVVGQAEGQKAVPQISLEAVGGRQLHQLAGETVRELRLRLR